MILESSQDIFHLAIPSHDLDAAHAFYVGQLGCQLARRYQDRITLNFFGHQVVCHLSPDRIDKEPEMYPRHFGMTFCTKEKFEHVMKNARNNELTFFSEPSIRFESLPEEHSTFFLKDPSNNLLEFKYYANPEMMY